MVFFDAFCYDFPMTLEKLQDENKELHSTLVQKEETILDLETTILDLETTILDLKEHVLKKIYNKINITY